MGRPAPVAVFRPQGEPVHAKGEVQERASYSVWGEGMAAVLSFLSWYLVGDLEGTACPLLIQLLNISWCGVCNPMGSPTRVD